MFVCCTPEVYVCNFQTKLNANAKLTPSWKMRTTETSGVMLATSIFYVQGCGDLLKSQLCIFSY